MINKEVLLRVLNFLGKEVEEKISGFTGVATQFYELYNGNVQVVIQPHTPGNTYSDGYTFDHHTVFLVKASEQNPRPKDFSDLITIDHFKDIEPYCFKNNKAVDLFTGFEGHIIARGFHFNGCMSYLIEGLDANTNRPVGEWFNYSRVRIEPCSAASDVVNKIMSDQKQSDTENKQTVGGPSIKQMNSMSANSRIG